MDFSLIDILTQLGNLGAPLSVSLMLFALMRQQMKAVNASLDKMLMLIERLALECQESPPTDVAAESTANDTIPTFIEDGVKTRPLKVS